MIITIYLKIGEGPNPARIYDLDKREWARLKRDYEQYCKQGSPLNGLYTCNTGELDKSKGVWLEFADIERIDAE